MRVKLESKNITVGEFVDIPDYSYNHYYSIQSETSVLLYYLVPETIEDAEMAMAPKSQKDVP